MEELFTIYMFTNKINGKKYIGSTIAKPNIRYNQHIYNATHENVHQYNYPLYQAMRKYGKENFDFTIVKQLKCSEEALREKEKEYIIKYNTISPNGYNQTLDTQHPINAKESYEKMSKTKRDNAKCVAELNDKNDIISIWNSIVDCAEQTMLSEKKIAAVCRGEQHTTEGRRFCWLDENNNPIIYQYHKPEYKGEKGTTQKQITNKKVAKIDINTKEILEIYDSIALAGRENNCDPSGITKVCRGKRSQTGGFLWKYYEEINNE